MCVCVCVCQVKLVCNYRRTLSYLREIHHGRLTPELLAEQLDVDITLARDLMDQLMTDKIISFKKHW